MITSPLPAVPPERPAAGWRRATAVAAVCLRIDARRPASWLAAAGSAAAWAWLVTAAPGVDAWPAAGLLPTAIVAGAVAAAMAVGDPPCGVVGLPDAWAGVRIVWPAVGAGCAAAFFPRPPAHAGLACLVLLAAAVATTWAIVGGRRGGSAPADAVGVGLALAGAAAAVAVAAERSAAGGAVAVLLAGGVWLVAAAAVRVWQAQQRMDGGWPVPQTTATGAMPSGAEGRLLAAAAMLSALAGMVAWLFLAPDDAGWYRLLAVAWFLAAAVPQATLGAGDADDAARRLVGATLPGAAAATRRAAREAWRPAAAWAAVFGWPLLVSAVLAPGPAAAVERLASAAGLAGVAGGLALLAAGLRRAGASRDTVLAAALAAGCGGGLVCSGMMLRESRHSCDTPGFQQCPPFDRGAVSCKEVHSPAGCS